MRNNEYIKTVSFDNFENELKRACEENAITSSYQTNISSTISEVLVMEKFILMLILLVIHRIIRLRCVKKV